MHNGRSHLIVSMRRRENVYIKIYNQNYKYVYISTLCFISIVDLFICHRKSMHYPIRDQIPPTSPHSVVYTALCWPHLTQRVGGSVENYISAGMKS